MKQTKILLLLMLLLVLLTACSAPEKASVDKIYTEVLAVGGFEVLTLQGDAQVKTLLGVGEDVISAHAVGLDASRFTPEAIFVLEAKNEEAFKSLQAFLQDYRDQLLLDYQNYRPEEVIKIADAQVLTKGLQLVLLIAPDQGKARTALDSVWK